MFWSWRKINLLGERKETGTRQCNQQPPKAMIAISVIDHWYEHNVNCLNEGSTMRKSGQIMCPDYLRFYNHPYLCIKPNSCWRRICNLQESRQAWESKRDIQSNISRQCREIQRWEKAYWGAMTSSWDYG